MHISSVQDPFNETVLSLNQASFCLINRIQSGMTFVFVLSISVALTIWIVQNWLTFTTTRLLLLNKPQLWSSSKSKRNFAANAQDLLNQGLSQPGGKPFRVVADAGEITILPPKYAHEIRDHDQFSFTKATFKWFHAHLPGFEGFREGASESQIIRLVARHQLTHQLTLVTQAVSEECSAAMEEIFTDDMKWHEVPIKDLNLHLMARITSRVFLGEHLCRDPQWLRITTTYTIVAFLAVEELRLWPSWLQPAAQWFLPNCTAARALVEEARRMLCPLLDRRRAEKTAAAKEGKAVKYNDAIEWLETTATERGLSYDPACAQLSLSVAALHSTTDFFTQAVLDICQHPEVIEPLRAEITSVIGQGNWTKHSLYKLKLMDSVLKESQRMKPIAIASMRRMTTSQVTLSDGVVLPKNCFTFVSADRHWSSQSYPKPNVWDGFRFFDRRKEPGQENTSQLVSVSQDHLGFGYGLHACPGRFFASEEIKIALCHMLMKYDFEIALDSDVNPRRYGLSLTASHTAILRIRRRKEEIEV